MSKIIELYEGLPVESEGWNFPSGEMIMKNLHVEYNISRPTLTVYPANPELNIGTSVIIAPGGGYFLLVTEHEGSVLAERLSKKGITAFLLRYRVKPVKDLKKEFEEALSHPETLEQTIAPIAEFAGNDGLQAVKYLRDHAEKLGIEPDRIGMVGFSAGGGVTLMTAFNSTEQNCPNFIAPIYAHMPVALVGRKVPSFNMPAFIAVAFDDDLGLAPTSFELAKKWFEAKQPVEFHAYEKGGHAFGMTPKGLPVDDWIVQFENWMVSHHYLK